jgi:hypothetical protein
MGAVALLCGTIVTTAAAQGKSGSAPEKNHGGGAAAAAAGTLSPATSTRATAAPSTSASSALYYGSWLDDASIMAPGSGWLGASTALWKASTGRQIDAPVMMGAIGLARRAQIGGSSMPQGRIKPISASAWRLLRPGRRGRS